MNYKKLFKDMALNQSYFGEKLGVKRSRMNAMLKTGKIGKHEKKLRNDLRLYATAIYDFLYNNEN